MNSQFLAAAAVAVLGVVAASSSQAAVIYADSMSGTGPLNGSSPSTATTYAGGNPSATWTASALLNRGATSSDRPAGTDKAHAWLPLNIQSGFTYTLAATLNPSGTSWAAVGFSVNGTMPATSNNFQDNNTIAWGLVRQSGAGQPQFFRGGGTFDNSGPGGASSVNFATGTQSGLRTMQITLDTTALPWTAVATIDGFTSTTKVFASAEPVKWVGLGSDQGTASFSNFSLTATPVPEPTTLASVAIIALTALKRRR